jgi:hypothetical protein
MAQVKLFRITGSGFVKQGSITPGHPIEFRHWKEVVDDADFALESAVHSEEEEAVVELWLEDPQSFQVGEDMVQSPAVRRVQAGNGLQRVSDVHHKQAAANWDQDHSEAVEHVRSVLSNLGNGVDRNYQYRPATPGKVK